MHSLTRGMPSVGRSYVRASLAFARRHLGELKRRTGEDYAEHGCEVALVLREIIDDPQLLGVAILNDLLVHPKGRELLRSSPLDHEGRKLVLGMHRLRRLHIEESTRDLDTVIDAFSRDGRLLLLRMAHRLNDVRNIQRFAVKLRRAIASETLHMYSSIAGRLGLAPWRTELEDRCFPVLHREVARTLDRRFADAEQIDRMCLRHARRYLSRKLRQAGIPSAIEERIKGRYSTYRKMVLKQRTFEEVTDRLALRVIVRDLDACYLTLGIVHAAFHLIPGKLKDYIGSPKENGYRSLHTVVYPLPGVSERPIEIQIRTEEMQRQSDIGVAAHGRYKDIKYALTSKSARANLFRNLRSLRLEARSPERFDEALRRSFREDTIVAFDADDSLHHLHKPASVLDFLAQVHGRRCANVHSVRLNGRASSLDDHLHDGDVVEARFGRDVALDRAWLDACNQPATKRLLRQLLTKSARPG